MDFASVTRALHSQAVYIRRTARMCRQTCRVADRKLMETMCPLLKTPCAAEKRSAPFCMLMYGWDRGIVAAPSVSTSWSRPGQTSTGRMCICFSIGSLCHVSEHSTTEQAVLANDLPAALSFLLI